MSASHRPHIDVAGLDGLADVADVEVDEPDEGGVSHVAGRGPVPIVLHGAKRVAFRQSRLEIRVIEQAFQLLDGGQPPVGLKRTGIGGVVTVFAVHDAGTVQRSHVAEGGDPIALCSGAVSVLQPSRSGAVVGNRAVVGGKAGRGFLWGITFCRLPARIAGNKRTTGCFSATV